MQEFRCGLFTNTQNKYLNTMKLGSQEGKGMNAKVIAIMYIPFTRYAFCITECGYEKENNDLIFFGYCVSMFSEHEDEWGKERLSELCKVGSLRWRGLKTMSKTVKEAVEEVLGEKYQYNF